MNVFRVAMLLVFVVLFGGLSVYLYRRLIRDVFNHGAAKTAGAGLLLSVFVGVPIVRLFNFQIPALSWVILFSWGVLLYALLALFIFDIAKWVARRQKKGAPNGESRPEPAETPVDVEKRRFVARAGAATALAVGGAFGAYGSYRAFRAPEVTEVPIRLPGLPRSLDGFVIVQLSDIHVGAIIQERFVDELVRTANRCKPDVVALTGDLVDGPVDQLGRYLARFQNLTARHGTFVVSGNHDYYSGWEPWASALQSMGLTVLRNRLVQVGQGADALQLLGVDDFGLRNLPSQYDLNLATSTLDPAKASVLLAHQPQNLEAVAAKHIGLQLSGHTHGGQVFPGTLVGDVMWGKRNAGLSQTDQTWLYTSRGCGFVGPPMRVGAPPEIVKVVLLSGAS